MSDQGVSAAGVVVGDTTEKKRKQQEQAVKVEVESKAALERATVEANVLKGKRWKIVINATGEEFTVHAVSAKEAWAALCDSRKSYPGPKTATITELPPAKG